MNSNLAIVSGNGFHNSILRASEHMDVALRPWALITGASSGLGREFAQLLAARGYHLIVTARRLPLLEALQAELQTQYPIRVQILSADLSQQHTTEQFLTRLDELQLPIELVINNAGLGYYGSFLEQSAEQIVEMLQLNVQAPTLLLHRLAQQMQQRGGGRILQVSSYAGLQPIPRYSVYSAAKAYGIALIQALRYEFRKSSVRLAVLAPGFMQTGFHDAAGHEHTRWMKLLSLPAQQVALAGLAGLDRDQWLITPGWRYRLNNLLLRCLPKSWSAAIAASIVKVKAPSTVPRPHLTVTSTKATQTSEK